MDCLRGVYVWNYVKHVTVFHISILTYFRKTQTLIDDDNFMNIRFPQQCDNLHSDVYGSHMISEAHATFLNINISLRYLKPGPD